MAKTYGIVNLISSFGFCVRWRRQCVQQVRMRSGDVVCDLMSGMGELWPRLARQIGRDGTIRAVDLSPVMCEHARGTARHLPRMAIDIRLEDALRNSLP